MSSEVEPFTLKLPMGDRLYQLSCPKDAPLGEVYEALRHMQVWCEERAKEMTQKQEESKDSQPIQE